MKHVPSPQLISRKTKTNRDLIDSISRASISMLAISMSSHWLFVVFNLALIGLWKNFCSKFNDT